MTTPNVPNDQVHKLIPNVKIRQRTREDVCNETLRGLLELRDGGSEGVSIELGGPEPRKKVEVSLADLRVDMTADEFMHWWNHNVIGLPDVAPT